MYVFYMKVRMYSRVQIFFFKNKFRQRFQIFPKKYFFMFEKKIKKIKHQLVLNSIRLFSYVCVLYESMNLCINVQQGQDLLFK